MKKIKIVITGQSNVGKSSMMNYLCNSYVSSVSKKPQTTRVNIYKSIVCDNVDLSIYDTPGVSVFDRSLLSVLMQKSFLHPLDKVDVLMIMLGGNNKMSEMDKSIIESAEMMKKKIIIVLNKNDLLVENDLIKIINELKKFYSHPIFSISIKTENGIAKLIDYIKALAKDPNDKTDIKKDSDIDKIFVQEIIRGSINDSTYDEVPYDCAVLTDRVLIKKNLIKIYSTIYVEKTNQKKIMIGESGTHIKHIGTNARCRLEDIFSKKIYLDLTVKIKKNWKNNYKFLKTLGYIS